MLNSDVMSEKGWQDRILAAVPSGIDGAQIEARLKLSPTERLERMRRFLEGLESARPGGGRRVPASR